MKNPLTPSGIETATFQFVAQHLSHCATAIPRMMQVEEKYFSTNYAPVGMLRSVNCVVCFIFKLQSKFRNKNCSSLGLIVSFHTGLH